MKSRSLEWLVISAVLAVVGLGAFFYKALVLGYPWLPGQGEFTWTVEARAKVVPQQGPVTVEMILPEPVPGFLRLEESFVSRGFGRAVNEVDGDRIAQWTRRRLKDTQSLYYRGVFTIDRASPGWEDTPRFPDPPNLAEPFDSALAAIVDDIRARSADVASFTLRTLEHFNGPPPDENTQLFAATIETPEDRVRVVRQFLSAARIPSEMVHGIRLSEERRRADHEIWLAVHNGRKWVYFDPVAAERGVPDDVLLWWRGDRPVAQVSGATLDDLRFSVRRNAVDGLALANARTEKQDSVFSALSLYRLPVETQSVYSVLLLVPLGALIIVLLRNVVGVRTFGTFMPVLIALSFRDTGVVAGIVLFSIVVSAGLLIRFYMEHLRLLLVPRLAAVLTIVVLLMAFTSLVSHSLGIEIGLSVALFPMVIMAMTIERMSVVWEEQGGHEAIRDGIGSLGVAALAFLVMDIELIKHLTFVFPELLLVLLSVIVMLGRYTGYRLSELGRFRQVVDFSGGRTNAPD
jgi:hypothetical protein